jgi:hypothetical protein
MGASTSGQTGGYVDLTLGSHSHTATVQNSTTDHTHLFTGNLASATIPAHTHTLNIYGTGGSTSGNFYTGGTDYNAPGSPWSISASSDSAHTHTISSTSAADADTHTHTFTINNAGVGQTGAGQNIPAYYTLIPVTRMV